MVNNGKERYKREANNEHGRKTIKIVNDYLKNYSKKIKDNVMGLNALKIYNL